MSLQTDFETISINNRYNDNPINLADIEASYLNRNYRIAINKILSVFKKLVTYNGITQKLHLSRVTDECNSFYTRLTAIFGKCLICPEVLLTLDEFIEIILLKEVYLSAFSVSGYHDTDFLIKYLNEELKQTQEAPYKNCPKQSCLKILLLFGLENKISLNFSELVKDEPILVGLCIIQILATAQTCSHHATEKKNFFLQNPQFFSDFQINHKQIPRLIARAYMFCTYSDYKKKHLIKKELNKILISFLKQYKIKPIQQLLFPTKCKPTLLIPLEHFTSDHAMFRCYFNGLATLKKYFHVVALVLKKNIDTFSEHIFNQIIKYDTEETIFSHIHKIIKKLKPSIIYYPSIGMQAWTIMLSTMRLAPIQIMTGGHPATSQSENIDYFIMEQYTTTATTQYTISEKLYIIPNNTFIPTIPLKYNEEIFATPGMLNNKATSINIAIAANVLKLTSRFLRVLKRIQETSSKEIHFHFFSNVIGVDYEHLKQTLSSILKNNYCYPSTTYDNYIDLLKNCDIYTSTFPFCGTNSTFDCLNLGIVPVAMEGDGEISSLHDASIIRELNLPSWLIAKTEQEYIDAVIRLINSLNERKEISAACIEAIKKKRANIQNSFHCTQFCESMWWLYQNHHKINNTEGPVIYPHLPITSQD